MTLTLQLIWALITVWDTVSLWPLATWRSRSAVTAHVTGKNPKREPLWSLQQNGLPASDTRRHVWRPVVLRLSYSNDLSRDLWSYRCLYRRRIDTLDTPFPHIWSHLTQIRDKRRPRRATFLSRKYQLAGSLYLCWGSRTSIHTEKINY